MGELYCNSPCVLKAKRNRFILESPQLIHRPLFILTLRDRGHGFIEIASTDASAVILDSVSQGTRDLISDTGEGCMGTASFVAHP
jgi:hypothetical protein